VLSSAVVTVAAARFTSAPSVSTDEVCRHCVRHHSDVHLRGNSRHSVVPVIVLRVDTILLSNGFHLF